MPKRQRLATVVLAALLCPGCMLRAGSGGYAGEGTVAGDGQDGGGFDETDGADADPRVGDGGGTDGGGDEDGGAAMHCSALPFGCACSPTEPSQVGACNTGSVIKMAGQRSVCCNSPYNCICVAYECVRISGSNCICQLAATGAGARVDDCGAVTGSPAIKCCRSYGQCVCSALDCLPIETQVSNCNIQNLLVCDAGNESVSRCEPAGAG